MLRKVLIAIAAAHLAACAPAAPEADEETAFRASFAVAVDQARASLPAFWKHHQAPAADEYDFRLRVTFPATDGKPGEEQLWIGSVSLDGEKLTGFLTVKPERLKRKRKGDVIAFNDSQIIDWAYTQGETLRGHFTSRVELPRMEPNVADQLRGRLADEPAPP